MTRFYIYFIYRKGSFPSFSHGFIQP